jgi:DNA-binding Xre family transcriptional regulator
MTNLVGACATCNQRKGARLSFDPNEPKRTRPAPRQPAVISRRETRKGYGPTRFREGDAPATFREWRAQRALSMADLVKIAGVTKTTIIAIEHGRVTAIKRKTIRRLAEALGVEPWDVVEFRRALSGDAPADED